MSYLHLAVNYRRVLTGAFFLSFFSGFGQSFFLSFFTPYFLQALSLSQTTFGLIYAGSTISSGLLLIWIGGLLDRVDPIRYSLLAIVGFAFACILLASFQSVWLLALALFGLRFCGQGLMSHIAATIIARGFLLFRGRALGLTGLGHPASEAILPTVAVLLTNSVGWRWTWVVFGCVMLFVFLPMLPYLLRGRMEAAPDDEPVLESQAVSKFTRRFTGLPIFARHWTFWYLVLGCVLPGFTLTALFIYHGVLAEERGWSMAWMATGFVWFACSQVVFSLLSGSILDKLSAKRVFAFHLLPLALGLALLFAPTKSPWVVPAYLTLAGISVGLGLPVKMALWAEIYGIRQIATIRSWVSAFSVVSTAVSPPILGYLLDANHGFSLFLQASVVVIVLYTFFYVLFLPSKALPKSRPLFKGGS